MNELSLIFVTSTLYCCTAWCGRTIRNEELTDTPKQQMIILGLSSMGSTYASVRSLRYVIYPVQVLGKSCKPIPVMLMGVLMGKRYKVEKFINVLMIVTGVALFIGGVGKSADGTKEAISRSVSDTMLGLFLLFLSLCCDGGTGAYEDKLMSIHHVEAFDLMFHVQFAKVLLSGIAIIVAGQITHFSETVQSSGMVLLLLGLAGAAGQVFIFMSIARFGALVTSIMGLARKILTLLASIVIYGHEVNFIQGSGLALAISAMIFSFYGGMNSVNKESPETVKEVLEMMAPVDSAHELEMMALVSEDSFGAEPLLVHEDTIQIPMNNQPLSLLGESTNDLWGSENPDLESQGFDDLLSIGKPKKKGDVRKDEQELVGG